MLRFFFSLGRRGCSLWSVGSWRCCERIDFSEWVGPCRSCTFLVVFFWVVACFPVVRRNGSWSCCSNDVQRIRWITMWGAVYGPVPKDECGAAAGGAQEVGHVIARPRGIGSSARCRTIERGSGIRPSWCSSGSSPASCWLLQVSGIPTSGVQTDGSLRRSRSRSLETCFYTHHPALALSWNSLL